MTNGSEGRPWYRQPETFVALAALVVSLSAVIVGIYEAQLQRAHDRAEVWPHLEISTYVTPDRAELYLENTGLGPAIINSAVVMVDGRPVHNWNDVLQTLNGGSPIRTFGSASVDDHALRAGDKTVMITLAKENTPPHFWDAIARVSIQVCYHSAFNDFWMVSDNHLGGTSTWQSVAKCPVRVPGVDF
jgi:hypothetical protein